VTSLLALGGALSWGVGDFLGGLASRRIGVLAVLAASQAAGLAGLGLWVAAAGDPFPGAGSLLPAAAAGAAGLVGLAALYRGLAVGAMGIVAPISGAAPLVPLAVITSRSSSLALVLIVALALSASLRAPRRLLLLLVGIGLFDTGANVLVAVATTRGAAGVVAVLSALYPVATVLLARLVLGERLSLARRAGGGIALAGAALVAAG
jgi:drug/metabolite transporter (DMT)-like permease